MKNTMLRVNLSTQPFYNERLVHLLLGLVGVAAALVCVSGVVQVTNLSRARTALIETAERDEAAAEALVAEALSRRQGVGDVDLSRVVAATDEANWLIDQRVFSWTAFFNHIEETLPRGVMLTSVRPRVEAGAIDVAIGVIGRRVADIDEFIAALEGTGAFADVLAREEEVTDEGMYRTLLVGRYVPEAAS